MFQLERLKVVNETLKQIYCEIMEGKLDDADEVLYRTSEILDTVTNIRTLIGWRKE